MYDGPITRGVFALHKHACRCGLAEVGGSDIAVASHGLLTVHCLLTHCYTMPSYRQ